METISKIFKQLALMRVYGSYIFLHFFTSSVLQFCETSRVLIFASLRLDSQSRLRRSRSIKLWDKLFRRHAPRMTLRFFVKNTCPSNLEVPFFQSSKNAIGLYRTCGESLL